MVTGRRTTTNLLRRPHCEWQWGCWIDVPRRITCSPLVIASLWHGFLWGTSIQQPPHCHSQCGRNHHVGIQWLRLDDPRGHTTSHSATPTTIPGKSESRGYPSDDLIFEIKEMILSFALMFSSYLYVLYYCTCTLMMIDLLFSFFTHEETSILTAQDLFECYTLRTSLFLLLFRMHPPQRFRIRVE